MGVPGGYSYIADKTETYTYNPDGTLKNKTDRNGKVTAYTYDIHGRLIKKAIGSVSISYTYDTASNVLNLTDATGTTTRTYDEENRVITKTVPIIGKSTYTYDTAETTGTYSELTTDPKGNVTKKVFDKAGRLIQVIEGTNTTTYTYLANGKRSSVIYPSGAKEVYTYLKDGLIQTLTNTKANGTILDAYSYTYDGAHNQTSKTDGRGITKYDYDVLNRLAKVTEPARNGQPERVTTYLFDAAGNRQQQTILQGTSCIATTYTYNEQNRLVMTLERSGDTGITETYDYDNNGNVMSKVKETVKTATAGTGAKFSDPFKAGSTPNSDVSFYTYDVWNNLASSIEGDKTAKYAYNGDGYRTEKNVNGQITRYLYEADKVVLETDGAGNQVARNVYGTNLLLRKVDGQTLYYMYNGHGDVTALIDSAGTTKGTYYYDAFGNVVEDTSNGLNNPILYAGYQYDKESGLYYLNARSYDPVTARFMQEDTYAGDASDPLSLNLYTYCHDEPVMYDDPSGHDAVIITNNKAVPLVVASAGHTSLIIINNDKYYYFYWGPGNGSPLDHQKPIYVEVPKEGIGIKKEKLYPTRSLEDFNKWLIKENITGGPYTDATYVQGDFSKSDQYARDVAKHTIYDYNPYIDRNYSLLGYDVIDNNCLQVSLRVLNKGRLNDGSKPFSSLEEDLLEGMLFPNGGSDYLKKHFLNSSFTKEGQVKAIKALIARTKSSDTRGSSSAIQSALSKMNMLIGNLKESSKFLSSNATVINTNENEYKQLYDYTALHSGMLDFQYNNSVSIGATNNQAEDKKDKKDKKDTDKTIPPPKTKGVPDVKTDKKKKPPK